MKKGSKKRRAILGLLALCLLIGGICIARGEWENRTLQSESFTLQSERLPDAFDGFTVAHISDLHGAVFGEDNEELLGRIREGKPDLIAVTGDIIDDKTDIETAVDFAKEAVKIAPTYYVTGNHEARLKDASVLLVRLREAGAYVLEDERLCLERDGESILVGGLADPSFADKRDVDSRVEKIAEREDEFLLLLSHRPELFDLYMQNEVDLTLCGHAHGGQIRLPFIGGIIAPGQGLFPKYDNGMYAGENGAMIVSRGIGNSAFPWRLGNRPHIVFVRLTVG